MQIHSTLRLPFGYVRFKLNELAGLDMATLEANVKATENFYTYDSVSKNFLCMECGWQSSDKEHVTLHIVDKHLSSEDETATKAVACPICKEFEARHPRAMRNHMQVPYGNLKCAGQIL